jgi:hypothetical protein
LASELVAVPSLLSLITELTPVCRHTNLTRPSY